MTTPKAMTTNKAGKREEWLAARVALLEEEKELTQRSDELARRRQELPWVAIDKEDRFDMEEGSVSLAEMFKGRSQLLVYHFMFGPDYKVGCPSCSSIADSFNGVAVHLENHDVAFAAMSRAPLAKLQAYPQRMGWTFPWASTFHSDFNNDFSVSFTEKQQHEGDIAYKGCGMFSKISNSDRGPASSSHGERKPGMMMSCCKVQTGRQPQPRWWRGTSGCVGSGALLVLLPKCPMCIAAYLTLWTGASVAMPVATHLRPILAILFVASALLPAIRWAVVRTRAVDPAGSKPVGDMFS